jgi:carboxypeptidase PM20D1
MRYSWINIKANIKNLLLLFLVVLSVIVAVLAVNTFRYTKAIEQDAIASVNAEIVLTDVDAVKRLAKAISFPTIYDPNIPKNIQAFHDLDAYLEANFPLTFNTMEVEVVSELSYLIKWQGTDNSLRPMALLSHKDVVSVDPASEADWAYPPFSGTVADGYIWGRGALDNKSGVLGLLEAAEYLLQKGFQPARTIYFAFGHDEEIGGSEGAAKIAELLAQRNVELEFVLDEGGYLITEGMPGADGPVAIIGNSEKGSLNLKLTTHDAGGHSSQPPTLTAAGRLARAVHRLQSNQFPTHFDHMAKFFQGMGDSTPFMQRMVFANAWLFERYAEHILPSEPFLWAGMRTTIAPTMLQSGIKSNVLPLTAEAVINFRIYPGETSAGVKARVIDIIDDEQVLVQSMVFHEPSPVSSTDSFAFQQLSKSIRQLFPDKDLLILPYLVVGGTDARHYNKVSIDSYRFIGLAITSDEISGFHGTNERIAVESYLNVIKIYIQFIKNSSVKSAP